MLKSLSILLRFFLFWLVFFFIDRIIFLVYFPAKLQGIRLVEILKTFVYGLWMDISMTAYICVLPLLIFIVLWAFPKLHLAKKWLLRYIQIIVAVFGIITIANFNIYREWGTKINYKALHFLFSTPNEALASSSSSPVLYSFMIFFAFAALVLWLAKKMLVFDMPERPGTLKAICIGLVLIGLNFLAIRGGWQLAPINESMAYFSDKPFLNHAAINTEWTLIRDILKNKYGNKNPYNYYPAKEAGTIVAELYRTQGDSVSQKILYTDRPNVIFILMESFTADVVERLGGEKGVAPNFDRLVNEGLLFSNAYASGDRTDKGMIAVLSGFPSQAVRSIINFNAKQERLPAISQELAAEGYHTSFYYGGESEFFNVKSYMLSHSYQKLVDKRTFERANMNSKWGAYDEFVFRKQLEALHTEKQPFFSTLLTLTNHEPFELPGNPKFPGEDIPNKFRSTAYYADSCLGAYINEAKKEPWFKNTLFVIVADHGHHLPTERYEIYDPHRFRIPLLFYGGALKSEFRGQTIAKITSQTDIAATLLSQLDMKSAKFKWSKDVLNPATGSFAFYNWDNGFGFATPKQIISFDNIGKQIIFRQQPAGPADEQQSKSGKAFMQEVFRQYMEY